VLVYCLEGMGSDRGLSMDDRCRPMLGHAQGMDGEDDAVGAWRLTGISSGGR
jgi:hypothetical protein